MKKISLLLLTLTICFFTACHDDIWNAIDDLDGRVTKLEELCKEMNTNITSLQTIVDVLQSNDFITGIVEITKGGKVVGYTITFGKHAPITIYHGQDGKDGQNGADGQDGQNGTNGADGQDGVTPIIGVAQDTDGVYYWTLNGEWLLDDNGNKLPVSGKDGANGSDGKDGQDGKDGADGQDGKDGITPLLKIEDGYWYVSYDNGTTWTLMGKATGADGQNGQDGANGTDGKNGQNGADGKDGQDGDSMFQSVTQYENYVYFTLADGTVIKIAKASEEEQSNSEFMFIVTYNANGGEGTMKPDTFYYGVLKEIATSTFTRDSYYFGNWNTKADGTGISYSNGQQLMISKNITLYANWKTAIENGHEFVDLGLPSGALWATMNIGATSPEKIGNKYAWGETSTKSTYNWKTYKFCTFYTNSSLYYMNKYSRRSGQGDWKTVLELVDDAARVNWGGQWKMPTSGNFEELCEKCTWTLTTLNGTNVYKVTGPNGHSIYLPATTYWSCVLGDNEEQAYCLSVSNNPGVTSVNRCTDLAIRPICP